MRGFLKNYLFSSIVLSLILFITTPVLTFSQKQKSKPDPRFHHEVKKDNFVPVSTDQMGRSPAYRYSSPEIVTVQVNVSNTGQNIVGDAANEPSIAINRNSPNKMAIGWRQFNSISSDFRQAGYAYTTNKGANWIFPGVINSGIFRSDPVLGSDAQGNFYYNSLTNDPDYYCKVFKSSTGGAIWDNGTDAHGGDKQWMTIDKTGGTGDGHIYAFWTSYFSTCLPGFFSRSTNRGINFQDCITIPQDPSWGTLAVAKSGDLFIAGTDGLSYDFLVAKSQNAKNPALVPTWNMATVVSLDGSITSGIDPNPGGLGGQTSIAVDTSGGSYNGYVYLLCSVDRNSITDPADVMFARSTNGGVTWSSPKRINDDIGNSAYQWFGTMSVAPNGRIDVIWLDTRDHPGTNISALYYSNSKDGGTTWLPNKKLSEYFDPHLGWPQQSKMGDYYDMISDYNGVNLAWAATFNGEQDVYYSFISDSVATPVELVSFSASAMGNIVTLHWSTATEKNNRGFEIERCYDRKSWVTVGFTKGNGSTLEPQHYIFSDKLMNLLSVTYYRLKQIDYNGNFEYSNIVEVNPEVSFLLSQNYPNPFNPVTTISYQLPVTAHVLLKVYDILGNEVVTLINETKSSGSYAVPFDGKKLSSGVYFYTLETGEYRSTKRMILMK